LKNSVEPERHRIVFLLVSSAIKQSIVVLLAQDCLCGKNLLSIINVWKWSFHLYW